MKHLQMSPFFFMFCLLQTTMAQNIAFTVSVTGKGSPVLLFPGFTCTAAVWNETIEELSKTHECHVFTFAGFGGVPAIDTPWLPTIKQEVVAYVKTQKLDKPTIIGHSLGGTLGYWLAATETDMFKKLIVIDALPCVGALFIPNFNPNEVSYSNSYSKQLLAMDSTAMLNMAQMQAASMSLNKDAHAQITDWIMQADRKTYVYGYVDLLKLDLREAMANINIPVVAVAATHPNRQMVMENWDKQLKKLPNKTILYADEAAHFVMYDQPEWFLKQIKAQVEQ